MNQADIFYRAFLSYRKETEKDNKCQKLRTAIREAGAEDDRLEAIRSHCIIEKDWVERIYEGLPFVEKALREERQHIRQQGDVVPIEKARRVSKNSVEHLARHSDMITHEPPAEEEDLVPDKIYVVEKLSDYAVYENRFLYMLLCYLRDFIDLRYSKIIELGNAYKASMSMNKTVKIGKRVIEYKVEFAEQAKDDPFGFFEGITDVLLKKIEEERHIISSLLLTPLMKNVAKSPKIKPPITRTNALRMDNNFKNALALYDYIAGYTKDGYRIETQKKVFNPFGEKMGDEFSEAVALTSFLVYEYGKDIKVKLHDAYLEEEARRRAEAEQRMLARLKELREKAKESTGSLEEYMLLLEERNRELEGDRRRLIEAHNTIAALEASIKEHLRKQNELKNEIDMLHAECEQKDAEMVRMREEFETEKQNIHKECDERIEALKTELEEEKVRMSEKLAEEKAQLVADLDNEKKVIFEENEKRILEVKEEYEELIKTIRSDLGIQIEEANKSTQMSAAECEALRRENIRLYNLLEKAREKCNILSAQLHAEKVRNGSIAEEGDFTDKERFSELEAEYFALRSLVEAEWKKAKKKIRKKILWKKPAESTEEYNGVSEEAIAESSYVSNGAVDYSDDSETDAYEGSDTEESFGTEESADTDAE